MGILSKMISFTLVKDGEDGKTGAMIYPLGEWNASTKYIGTALAKPYVLYKNERYILNVNGELLGGLTPADDVAQNKGNWLWMTNYKAIYTDIIMANFGNIGEAIFNGEWEFSQSGIDELGNPTSEYKNFNPNQITGGKFTPYTLYNHKTGYVHFGGGQVVIKDGKFNKLLAKDDEDNEISIETKPLRIRFLNKNGYEVLSLHNSFSGTSQQVGQLKLNWSNSEGKLLKVVTIDANSLYMQNFGYNQNVTIDPTQVSLSNKNTQNEISISMAYSGFYTLKNTKWPTSNEVFNKGEIYVDGNTLKVKE